MDKITSAENILRRALKLHTGRIALSSSLSIEDQVLADMLVRLDPTARIFTLDTGRLFPETYSLIDRTNKHFGIRIEVFFPEREVVEAMVNGQGIDLFYDSLEARKQCCRVRKIEPLRRAFSGLDAWICGLRREQSITRTELQPVERDEANGLTKINPLFDWTETEVWDYIRANNVPYNTLYDEGFPSIGCQPCTRAIVPGADPRSGRWWWESPEHKECGLHRRPSSISSPAVPTAEHENDLLTATEKEILRGIVLGYRAKEIAAQRYVSEQTVTTHRKNIYRKLEVNNSQEAARYALRAGIVDASDYSI